MKHIGDLILTENLHLDEDLIVEGNINCDGGLWNIKARYIKAWDIDAGDIDAGDISARDISAGDIDAMDVLCKSRKKKTSKNKTLCRFFAIRNPMQKVKEWLRESGR